MFDITNINPSANSLSIWVPAIIGLLVGWTPPVFQFFTEGKKIRKQLTVQREIDDLVNFKSILHSYYFETIAYHNFKGSTLEPHKKPKEISDKIKELSLKFNRQIILVSHYFTKQENDILNEFSYKFVLQETNVHFSLLKDKQENYNVDTQKTEKLFKELIVIINTKIN